MIGDLAGFAAATYLRGLPLVQLPTSLLAMVDASIGGKVAVNQRQAKNLIGAFYQPRLVFADVSMLQTLPERELTSGWAEVVKHALVMDPHLLLTLEEQVEALRGLQPEVTTAVVRRSMALKAQVVSEDERETTGRRSILNYGHTVGHALEAAAGYGALLHGEAVALGMVAAAEIGRRLGLTPPDLAERQRALLERFGLIRGVRGIDADARAGGDEPGQEGRREGRALGAAGGRGPACPAHRCPCLARPAGGRGAGEIDAAAMSQDEGIQERKALRAVVSGIVQAVGFRQFVILRARGLGLTGYVRNGDDGRERRGRRRRPRRRSGRAGAPPPEGALPVARRRRAGVVVG